MTDEIRLAVWTALSAVPTGRVITYGQLAAQAGVPRRARLMGRFLSELPVGTALPWHRVVNAQGRLSSRAGGTEQQRLRLEGEGIVFVGNRINLKMFGVVYRKNKCPFHPGPPASDYC